MDTGHVTQKLYPRIFWKFYSGSRYVGETPGNIDKMTNFWWLVSSSIIWSLATLCDTSIRIRENHWLLRLIRPSFSESLSEYESVFQIFAWKIIHDLEWWKNVDTLDINTLHSYIVPFHNPRFMGNISLREKCPNTGLFLVRFLV